MELATFRKWLSEHGCRFGMQSEKCGEGHGTLTIHRAWRTAELSLADREDKRVTHGQAVMLDGVEDQSCFDPSFDLNDPISSYSGKKDTVLQKYTCALTSATVSLGKLVRFARGVPKPTAGIYSCCMGAGILSFRCR
jgi:hypothetical protein